MIAPYSRNSKSKNEETRPYILVALLVGILMIVASYLFPKEGIAAYESLNTLRELLREFGVVLVSVWGVSLFYEKFLAEKHFTHFYENLEQLIRRGETNAAVCEGLGILAIYQSRRLYEDSHSLAVEAKTLGEGDIVRLTGRSLIFTMYGRQHLKMLVENGATLQLCLFDPVIQDSPLNYLAGYSAQETELTIHRFVSAMKPWLETAKPKGSVELRFHRVHLLDSLLQIKRYAQHRVAWDLNFGEGTEQRYVVYLNGDGPLGRSLTEGRYQLVWDQSEVKLRYEAGSFLIDQLGSQISSQLADAT